MRSALIVFVVLASVLVLGTMVAGAADDRVTVAGSSTVRPVVEKAAQVFKKTHAGTQFAIGGGGSSHGVKAAASGEVVIGMASRDLKDKEQAEWKTLVPVKIGMDGIAVIVNAKAPITKITKQQVQDIFTGTISNWKELGGEDAEIILISKEEGRSTLDLFLKYFDLEAEEVVQGGKATGMVHRKKGTEEYSIVKARLIGPNREALAAVSLKKHAIAYVSIGTAQEVARKGGRIKILDLDGVAATVGNVANQSYPLRRPLNVITNGPAQGVAKEFIGFLTGDQGQTIVTDLEFISIDEAL